jgi:Tat protein secretion system quality control protein TatD with DNase activity
MSDKSNSCKKEDFEDVIECVIDKATHMIVGECGLDL